MGRREPVFLTVVMDTIANLKDSKGSPPDRILDRIVSQRKTPLKNASLQVKKALKTGLKTGLLKEVGGKFKLGLGSKDYAIFKNFRQLEKGASLPITEMRRKGRRGRSRRRKRRVRKRKSDYFDVDSLGLKAEKPKGFSLLKLAKSATLPVKELRRRARRGKSRRRRRRGRKGRGKKRSDFLDLEDVEEMENDSSEEPMDRGRRGRRRSRRRGKKRGRRRALEEEEQSLESSESKEIASKSSEEKPKTASKPEHGDGRNPAEKRDIVPEPPKNRVDNESDASEHCIHNFHHDGAHYGHPPHQGYYGGEYYD